MLAVFLAKQRLHNQDAKLPGLRGFRLFLRAYALNSATGTFEAVPGMPPHLPGQIRQALDALHKIESKGAAALPASGALCDASWAIAASLLPPLRYYS